MLNKKALSNSAIIGLVLAIIFFIIASANILSYLDGIGYDSSLVACNQFFKSVNGDEIYFDKLNEPTSKFNQSFAEICSAKTIDLNNDNIRDLVDLSSDCWNKFGKGREFIGPYMLDTKLCFYCGKGVVRDDIEDFNGKFEEIIISGDYNFNESSSSVNLNKLNLAKVSLPNKLNEGENVTVIYTIYKDPNFGNYSNAIVKKAFNTYVDYKTWVDGEISDSGGWLGLASEIFASSSGVDVHSGVMLTRDLDKLSNLGCKTLIPIIEYEE